MTDKEILLDLLNDFAGIFQWVISDLSYDALCWQPDHQANSIGVTAWHVCRSFDVLAIRILANRPHTAEAWCTYGWHEKTGYNPHGVGFAGWGTLARFTQAEVAAIPNLTADELLTYFEQTKDALYAVVSAMTAQTLYQPPIGWPNPSPTPYAPDTAYASIKAILMDTREHLGEIKALKAMWMRDTTAD